MKAGQKKALITPFEAGKRFSEWFSGAKRVSFFAALLAGFAAHFLLLVWGLMSQDGLTYSIRYFASDWEISLGRWGQIPITHLRAGYSVSYLSASLSLFYTALAALFMTAALELEKKLSAILTGIGVAVAPSVLTTLLYENLSDSHSLALLFGCMGGYFLVQKKKGVVHLIPAILCMVASLSIYQSFIGFSLGLLLMATILRLLFGRDSYTGDSKVFLKGFLSGIVAFLIYTILTKIFQALSGNGMSTYYGVSDLGAGKILTTLPASLYAAYKAFFQYFIRNTILYNTPWRRHYFFMVFFAAVIALGVIVIFTRKIYREVPRFLLLLILSALLPAGLNLIQLIVPDSEIYIMTAMQMVLVIPFALAVCENAGSGILKGILEWAIVLTLIPVLATYYFSDILSYKALKETSDQAMYGAERVLDRIETTEGYEPGMPVAFAGWFFDDGFMRDQSYWEYSIGSIVVNNQTHPNYGAATESIRKLYLENFGVSLTMADPATYLSLIDTEEFEEMDAFPGESSVQIIDGTVLVKMLEEPFR